MKKKDKFLENVARYYLDKSADLRRTLLIFPNKRAIIFMRQYLKRCSDGAILMPAMRTMTSFLSEIADVPEASRLEQLFTLYDAYCEVSADIDQTPARFDSFRFWGDIMLEDFDDIDRQLIDADEIFTNLKRIQEIRTDFLDEEQRKVAMEIWGYDPGEAFEGFRNNHHRKEGSDDKVYDEFVKLTEVLNPIYQRFEQKLMEQGLATRGMITRAGAELTDSYCDTLKENYDSIGFVGFGILSKAERTIFNKLRNRFDTAFFWDRPITLHRDLPPEMEGYKAPLTKYIDLIEKDFPAPADFHQRSDIPAPRVMVMGVPSNVMQVKVTANILQDLDKKKELNPRRVDNTVVVMPDTSLLVPLIHSVGVEPVNVTLALPIRHTPFATLLSLVIRLNMSARHDSQGDLVFVTQNVVQVLSHPSLTTLFPEQTAALRGFVEEKGRYVIKVKDLKSEAPRLGFVFDPLDREAPAATAYAFIDNLINGMLSAARECDASEPTKKEKAKATPHELRVLEALKAAVETLSGVIEKHRDNLADEMLNAESFIRLLEKLIYNEPLSYNGSPLKGVQIMGALETRSLDFDNVIMLSMNEKTFPPKNFSKSMLPVSLRLAFGMTGPEEQELQYAWIYANLLSRSDNVFALHDTASEAKGTGGKSRYLFQTEYIFNGSHPETVTLLPDASTQPVGEIRIEKNGDVRAELDRFKAGGDLNLSVSALLKYAECPLKFYLNKVKNIAEPPRVSEAIDAMALGNVVHETMDKIYDEVAKTNEGIMDSSFSISEETIKRLVTEALDREWYFGQLETYENMPPQAQLQIDLWTRKIVKIVELEKARGPYRYVKSELSPKDLLIDQKHFDWPVSDGLTVRFTFFVDRVDQTDEHTLRFIDYKTGKDKRSVTDMDVLFWEIDENSEDKAHNKVIFQLLTYAHAYEEVARQSGHPWDGDITVELTQVLSPEDSIGKSLSIEKKPFTSYKAAVVKEFLPRLKKLIASIFDTSEAFTQTPHESRCLYCQFKNICQRNPEKKF